MVSERKGSGKGIVYIILMLLTVLLLGALLSYIINPTPQNVCEYKINGNYNGTVNGSLIMEGLETAGFEPEESGITGIIYFHPWCGVENSSEYKKSYSAVRKGTINVGVDITVLRERYVNVEVHFYEEAYDPSVSSPASKTIKKFDTIGACVASAIDDVFLGDLGLHGGLGPGGRGAICHPATPGFISVMALASVVIVVFFKKWNMEC